jgi:hypothetical protein
VKKKVAGKNRKRTTKKNVKKKVAEKKSYLDELLKFLISEEFTGYTDFHSACREGNLNLVQSLVQQGFDMNTCNYEGSTGFHFACSYGCLNVVKYLISCGININEKNNYDNTGFMCACEHNRLEVVKYLTEVGCQMNETDINGETGFIFACEMGHIDVVKHLVLSGCNINQKSCNRRPAWEVGLGHPNIAVFLIEHGCEFNSWLIRVPVEIDQEYREIEYTMDLARKFYYRTREIEEIRTTILNFWIDVDPLIIDKIVEMTCGLQNVKNFIDNMPIIEFFFPYIQDQTQIF